MKTFQETIIANSSIDAGATEVSDIGSTFEIRLQQPIHIPSNLIECYVKVDESTVWWTIPNISVQRGNNKLYLEYLTVAYVITIPDGLYSVSDLSEAIDREIVSATGVSGLVSLSEDNATQRVVVELSVATLQLDLTQPDTFRDIIGFDSQLLPAVPSVGPLSVLGDSVAQFNTIEYFLLHSDIVTQGIRTNNTYSQTIAQILIDVPPGSQIVSREFNPPRSDALELSGQTIDRIRFWLTDQNNVLVNTNSEDFGCRMVITYSVPT